MNKPKVKKPESAEKLRQMRLFYETEKCTLEEVGERFGMSRQAVSERFRRAKIKINSAPKRRRRLIAREILEQLYVTEKLTMPEVAERLQVSCETVNREIERYNIRKRSKGYARRKIPQIWELKVGEKHQVKKPSELKNFYRTLHAKAFHIGIKITVKRIEGDLFEMTRLR